MVQPARGQNVEVKVVGKDRTLLCAFTEKNKELFRQFAGTAMR